MKKKSAVHAAFAPKGVRLPPPSVSSAITSLFGQGLALHQAGRLADAERIYNQILATRPDHFDSLHLLGVIFYQRGDYAEAVRRINLALKRSPNNFLALNNRGNALVALRQFTEALASYERAITAQPDYAEAHSNRADALNPLERFDEALGACERALVVRPDFAEARVNRGNALHKLKRFEAALASHDHALRLRPDYAEAYSNRGNTLHETKRFEEALASYDRALTLKPDYAEAHSNRGNALQELKRFDEAVASYDRALALRGDLAEAHSNRGNALKEMARFDDALASFDRAIAVRPDFADAHFNEAMCRLLIGDFDRGWEKNEWRWQTEQLRDGKRSFSQPLWLGSDAIAGKTILLHAEQGLGDTVQFGRYLAPLFQVTGCEFFSLQKGDDAVRQLRDSDWRQAIIDHMGDLHDFSDTAALIENLDLVISVDTSVAHLAGALGKPFWLLNRYNTCWRWLLDREDSPWYPTARLFRQDATRAWEPLIARVAAALSDHVRAI